MFRKLTNQHATDDHGVDIRSISATVIEYKEGPRVLRVGCEGGVTDAGDPAEIIYFDITMRWQPPHENDPLTSQDFDRIEANMVAGLHALEIPVFVVRRHV